MKVWMGRILSGFVILFLAFDGASKFFLDKLPPQGLDAITSLGWTLEKMPAIGAMLLVLVVIHLIPRTAVLGAILLTGYLGGAVASQVRVGNPLFSFTLFPVYVAILLWLGLSLRDRRVGLILKPA